MRIGLVVGWVAVAGFLWQADASSSQGADSPSLSISFRGGQLRVSWAQQFWDYKLQYQPNTVFPPRWVDVLNPVLVTNGAFCVTLDHWNHAGFFRLVQGSGEFVNSIGMRLSPVPAGRFTMGYWQDALLDPSICQNVPWWVHYMGDYDEIPAHDVVLSHSFWLGTFEVSNREYEQFDPSHAALRGKLGFAPNDDDAVVFVSWEDAKAFCDWLSAREGKPYRLPTEAEWEYACRAGTTTHFSTGDTLPDFYLSNTNSYAYPLEGTAANLARGQTPPNPWGFYDMHGNVEEWCSDWFGPYDGSVQTDPVGRSDGLSKVARGGSHSTFAYYLRSENRLSMLPEDRNWYIGFRVALGTPSVSAPLPVVPPPTFQQNVVQTVPRGLTNGPDLKVPYFSGPLRYVNMDGNSYGPVYSAHNHDCGGIVECPNGDLLTVWMSCITEDSRDPGIAASRLRYGTTNWDVASSFYDLADRNDMAPCLWFDGNKTIYFFCGFSPAATYGPLAILMRTSTNNGADWSRPRIVIPEHSVGHQPDGTMFRMADDSLAMLCDALPAGNGGTLLWASADNGSTWRNLAGGRPAPDFADGASGAWIAGIHAQMTTRRDGSFLAFGRGDPIDNAMPRSVSTDGGVTWTYSPTGFAPIGSTRRATMLRLAGGPLFFASFSDRLTITNAVGTTRIGSGLFAAVSFNDGVSWPFVRLVSDDGAGRVVETMDGVNFTMDYASAEPYGYLASTQGKNGVIHLISSRQHYMFNLKWLTTRPAK